VDRNDLLSLALAVLKVIEEGVDARRLHFGQGRHPHALRLVDLLEQIVGCKVAVFFKQRPGDLDPVGTTSI
jgi:hypothetical protein